MNVPALALLLAVCAAGVGYALGGALFAVMGAAVGAIAVAASDVLAARRLPPDAAACGEAALAAFKQGHPEQSFTGWAVRDVDERRFIISVRHGLGRPDPRTYYAVRRSDRRVTPEDTGIWWPRGLK